MGLDPSTEFTPDSFRGQDDGASGLLRLVFAAEHDDLARADVFHDFELLQQALERIDLDAVARNLDDHGRHRHIHRIGVEMVAKLQNLGALFCGAANLDKSEFLFDCVRAGMVLCLDDIDELFELLDDLHQDFGIAVCDDVHAAEVRVERGGDNEGIDVVTTAGEHESDAHEHARAVCH